MKQEQLFKLENNIYTFSKWEQYGVKVYFSSKHGGNSCANYATNNLALHVGDNPDNVVLNRHHFAKQINQDLNNFVYSNQTHSTNVRLATTADASRGTLSTESAFEDTDGLYSFENNLVLNAFVADCTPVYIIEPSSNFICVIHAGWQGTVKSIVYNAINNISKKHNLDVQKMKLLIGPSIEQRNFEVEQNVIDLIHQMSYLDFASCYEQINPVKYLVNVKRLNYLQAVAAGIKNENIFVTDIDTYSNDNLFSYRQNNQTGRMCASIYQENN